MSHESRNGDVPTCAVPHSTEVAIHEIDVGEIPSMELLSMLDRRLEQAYSDLRRAECLRIIEGNIDAHREALHVFRERTTVPVGTYNRLAELSSDPDPGLAGWARALWSRLRVSTSEREEKERDYLYEWRKKRQQLTNEGNMKGAPALKEAINTEENAAARELMYAALYGQDEELATLLIGIRNKRVRGYDKREDYIAQQLESCCQISVSEAHALIDEMYAHAVPLWSIIEERILGHGDDKKISAATNQFYRSGISSELISQFDIPLPNDLLLMIKKKVQMLGLEDLMGPIRVEQVEDVKDTSACIAINPPHEVVVVVHTGKLTHFFGMQSWYHEVGHGLHGAGIDAQLPFAYRSQNKTGVWSEAMAFIFEDMMAEPDTVSSQKERDEEMDKNLYKELFLERVRSAIYHLCLGEFELHLYQNTSDGPRAIEPVASALYRKYYPTIDTFSPYWWANEVHITEYPFSSLSYLVAWLVAAQIRAYAKKTFGCLACPQFGQWLKEKCYNPGYSKPWRELLRDATGEDLNPQYFFDELDALKQGAYI